jgi:DNA-binding MarR family transcriptional regulator
MGWKGREMTTRELLSLFEADAALLRTFEAVAKERKIRFGALRETLGLEQEDILEKLGELEQANLIKSQEAPGQVEDLRWYSITAEGLATERELNRLELAR